MIDIKTLCEMACSEPEDIEMAIEIMKQHYILYTEREIYYFVYILDSEMFTKHNRPFYEYFIKGFDTIEVPRWVDDLRGKAIDNYYKRRRMRNYFPYRISGS